MSFINILKEVDEYYTQKLLAYGPNAKGVDWSSPESQQLRFAQLLKVCDPTGSFSINDYGCGYGALVDYLAGQGWSYEYRGADVSQAMIAKARELHSEVPQCEFFADEALLHPADYTVASGIFNVKLGVGDDEWTHYVLHTVNKIAALSRKGFAFNCLTQYSDPERMRPDLYYADPLFWFDYCKRHFSKFVALLHDYPLYEFTILVRL